MVPSVSGAELPKKDQATSEGGRTMSSTQRVEALLAATSLFSEAVLSVARRLRLRTATPRS